MSEPLKRASEAEPLEANKKTRVEDPTPVAEGETNPESTEKTGTAPILSVEHSRTTEVAEKEQLPHILDSSEPSKKLEDNADEQKEEATKNSSHTEVKSSATPVFGATSTFGKLQNAAKGDSGSVVDVSKDSNSETATKVPLSFGASFGSSFGSSFGANSKFGNAFQNLIKKKSFLDEPEEPKTSENNEKQANDTENTKSESKTDIFTEKDPVTDKLESSPKPEQYKQVDLEPVLLKTGEEEEKSVFTANIKLFELDLAKISEGWKERGVGPLHLNQLLLDLKQIRLVLRLQGLLRVMLNQKITKETQIMKGLQASLSPGKFLRINLVSSKGTPIQYLLKFSNEETRNNLYDKIEELRQ